MKHLKSMIFLVVVSIIFIQPPAVADESSSVFPGR